MNCVYCGKRRNIARATACGVLTIVALVYGSIIASAVQETVSTKPELARIYSSQFYETWLATGDVAKSLGVFGEVTETNLELTLKVGTEVASVSLGVPCKDDTIGDLLCASSRPDYTRVYAVIKGGSSEFRVAFLDAIGRELKQHGSAASVKPWVVEVPQPSPTTKPPSEPTPSQEHADPTAAIHTLESRPTSTSPTQSWQISATETTFAAREKAQLSTEPRVVYELSLGRGESPPRARR